MPQELDGLLKSGVDVFKTVFSKSVPKIAVSSPTKANIIGEQVEFQDGIVLSINVPLYTLCIGGTNDTNTIRVFTADENVPESERLVEFPIPSVEPLKKGGPEWSEYVKGTLELFKGYVLEGFDMVVFSNVPQKVGLASSSVLCVSVYTFLESLTKEVTVNIRDKASRCMKAEGKFTNRNVNTLMDIYAILNGQENYVCHLDCRDMKVKHIPFDGKENSLLIINSNKPCAIEEEEEKTRRKLCQDAARILGVKTLRDAKTTHFKTFRNKMIEDKERDMRARHVHSEIKRAERAIQALQANDFPLLGRLMNQTQTSLKYDCEVSSPEIDEIVEIVLEINGVHGAKMLGPGFGGCVIVLLKSSSVDEVVVVTKRKYSGNAEFYLAEPANKVKDISYMVFNLEKKSIKVMENVSTQLEYTYELFSYRYNAPPEIATQAPGRITLLGDHTCSENGFVLQLATSLTTIVAGRKNCTNFINVYVDEDFAGDGHDGFLCLTIPLYSDLNKNEITWKHVVYTAVNHFKSFEDEKKQGFDIVIVSTVPDSAGLGRNCSIVTALYTFMEIITDKMTPNWKDKAMICYLAENEINPDCSLADYLTVIAAEEDKLVYVDCANGDVEMIPFRKEEYAILLIALTNIDPEERFPRWKTECADLLQVLGVESLRDADVQIMNEKQDCMTFGMYKRGLYIVQEMIRTYQAVKSLYRKDYESFGALLLQSHNSLRYHFEHVHPSLNQIVALTMKCPGVLGTKMISSERTSCTVSLVRNSSLESVIDRIHCGYKGNTLFYTLKAGAGVQNISETLNAQLRRNQETVAMMDEQLSVVSVPSSDLKNLSWLNFDVNEEWADFTTRRTKTYEELAGELTEETDEYEGYEEYREYPREEQEEEEESEIIIENKE